MLTLEQTIDMQRTTIEEPREGVKTLKEELEDFRELKRQKWIKKQVDYIEPAIWNNELHAPALVALIATLVLSFYIEIGPGKFNALYTIAFWTLVTFGIAYISHREKLQRQKQYIAAYQRQYGTDSTGI